MEELFAILKTVIESRALVKIVFSRPKRKDLKKAEGRVIELRGLRTVQIETFTADGKALHKNVAEDSALRVFEELSGDFSQINVFTTGGECEALISKKGKCTVINRIKGDLTSSQAADNDRAHRYVLDPAECAPFLYKLGICDAGGRVRDAMRHKFRQINRFTEILSDVYPHLPENGELVVCDLCCGKSYLTFAVYYFLTQIKGRKVKMYGMDLKSDVIAFCAETAKELGFEGMTFLCGDVSSFEPEKRPSLVVSLHACDTATDLVLYNAIRLGAKVILSTPCCHHEMMKQLPGDVFPAVEKHPLLKQKLCDAFTDALRCKMLEAQGYKVTTLELIDPEETPKNIMIKAVAANVPKEKKQKALEEYKETCRALGVSPALGRLLEGGSK